MSIVFGKNHKPANGLRLTGFARYTEILGRDIKSFLIVNLFTVLGFLPFLSGVAIAILSSSLLVLIPSCVIGGLIAGPALAAMYDCVYRSLRDASGNVLADYKTAWKQNWKNALIPGIIYCLMIGVYCFMIMLFSFANRFPGWGTIAVLLFSVFLFTMFFSIYWPQIVLFHASARERILNSLLFNITFFWKMAGITLLQLIYWGIMALLLPWSGVLMLLIGFWLILFTVNFLIYNQINQSFALEQRIAEAFPEQAPFYETNEMWLQRKQREEVDHHE